MSQSLDSLISSIDTALDVNGDLLQEEDYEKFKGLQRKIDNVLVYAKTRLNSCPPVLLQPSHLKQIEDLIGNIITSISSYISNKNIAHLHNEVRDQYLPNLIANIQTKIPSIVNEVDAAQFTGIAQEAIQNIRSKSASVAQAFRSEQAGLDRQFAELKSKKESLDKALEDFQSGWDADIDSQKEAMAELQAELKANIEELKEALAEEEKNIVALNGTFGEKFQLAEKERATEALTALNDFKSSMKEALVDFKTEKNNAINNLREELKKYNEIEAPEILASLESKKNEAKKLLGMISGSTMADGYNKTANKEEILANKFRNYASWLWIFAAAATGWLIHSLGSDPTVGKVLARVAYVIVLAAPATYMTIESRGHRLEERRNRRYAVEMMALDPYLSPLDDETRKQKIEALVTNYFGNIEKQHEVAAKMPLEQILEICKDTCTNACKTAAEVIKKVDKPT
ncbi:hypothetical protein [uncultured Pseudodesulfovibrio sp.]|uniref:hypothetical protein n=1 Tax=uncultured Pseudodesulfovibrio sp. TaxID=2035858 RepID=UPI0029C6948B|nr:hypothetical protein [uncultured Pseudodesulfovibrio sp.]